MARTIAKDHGAKRSHILRTAAGVFADQGFAGASMSEVAASCGISKANIYHYYPGKDALLFDILDTYLSELRTRLCSLPLDGLSPSQKLHLFTRETLLAYQGMDAEHQIQAEGLSVLLPARQEILKGYQRDIVNALSSILKECAPDVFADDKRKLISATMSVFGMLNWFYMWNGAADEETRISYADMVAKLTTRGIPAL